MFFFKSFINSTYVKLLTAFVAIVLVFILASLEPGKIFIDGVRRAAADTHGQVERHSVCDDRRLCSGPAQSPGTRRLPATSCGLGTRSVATSSPGTKEHFDTIVVLFQVLCWLSLILSPLCPGSVCQAASPRGHWSPTRAVATHGSGEAASSEHEHTLTRIPQVLGRGGLGGVHRLRVPRRAHPEGGPPGRGQGLQGRDHDPAEDSPPGAQI